MVPSPLSVIRLDEVHKRYANDHVAVEALTLDIPAGDVCVLIGPSGCGKTTVLRMINRLVEPTSGHIAVDGVDVATVDPVALRRGIGYVIQRVGLFPHQTVAANIATVPRLLGWDRARIRTRVDELLELVGLAPDRYRTRYPAQLSGGQQQRVGVARALAADPPVLLMDEPFGAIDPITRDALQHEFARLQAELRKTVVFVTHDVDEAVRLGDRIAVLSDGGVLEQYAEPAVILGSPASEFVAEFIGRRRTIKQLQVTAIDAQRLLRPPVAASAGAATGGPLVVVVDPGGEIRGCTVAGSGLRSLPAVTDTVTLDEALAAVLQSDDGRVAVTDAEGRYLGLLTPDVIHATLRASRDGRPDA